MDSSLILLCVVAVLAGFIDSIVGGGGLVQIPAFFVLFPALPVSTIIATNRFASAVGTSVAAWNYARKIAISWKAVGWASLGASAMSYLGATIQPQVPSEVLKPVILFLIVGVAIYTYKKKDFGGETQNRIPEAWINWSALGVGMVMGFYNGLIGPGTGSLLVFGLVRILGYSFLQASPQAKIINVVADVSSLVFFIAHGYVIFEIALPLMVCNVIGSYLGSHMAMLRGNAFVRQVFLWIVGAIILRFAYDLIRIY